VKIDAHAMERKRQALRDQQYKAFINEVARTANELQAQQPDLSRSEALRVAEIMVMRANAEKKS
jgi:hypothetical protein